MKINCLSCVYNCDDPSLIHYFFRSSNIWIFIYSLSCGIIVKYSQTLLLRTPLGPEKVFVLQSVLIKWVNFKENVWSGTKKTVRNNECPY